MEATFKDNVISNKLINPKDTILGAISGGPDSMAMLNCLINLRDTLNFNLLIAHVNHGVRGQYAKRDQEFVRDIAKEYNIPFFTTNVDMVASGKELGISSEEAGRILRYGFFRRVLLDFGGGKISVAHNKNDQAETLIHRFLRGTGLDGLRAMDFEQGDIIRPILNISREEIEAYIERENIPYVIDHTNLETTYTRNKIRLELIPYIKENFNPNIIDTLYRLSSIASGEVEIIEEITKEKYNLLVKKTTNNSIIFKGGLFNLETQAIRKRLIRKAIETLLGNLQGVEEVHIEESLKLFEKAKTGKRIDIGRGLRARISYNDYIIELGQDEKNDLGLVNLKLGDNILEDWGIIISLDLIPNDKIEVKNPYNKYIDFDKLEEPLFIRPRQKGDVFSPLGMDGSKKLKDYMIDKKIPQDKRDTTPILCDKSGIIWVIGYGLSDKYKITQDTRKALKINIKNIGY